MSDSAAPSIEPARVPEEMDLVRSLFLEYADWLQVDLCFQGFEVELAGLPGRYAPPAGGIWIARVEEAVAGIVGMRPLEEGHGVEPGTCELKRLWVREGYRDLGLGRRLTEIAIAAAREAGHRRMVLDTLPMMTTARALYRRLGFEEIPAYYHNPEEGVLYLVRAL